MALSKTLFFLLFACLITSCSNFEQRKDFISNYFTFEEKPYVSFNRSDLDNVKYPLIEVRTNHVIKQVLLLQISYRDGFANYFSGSGQALTMQGALITKTNGFDANLISLKIPKNSSMLVLKSIDKWKKSEKRTYKFVTSGFQEQIIEVLCERSFKKKKKIKIYGIDYDLTKVVETCRNSKLNFENIYWVDYEGFVWRSKQWVSPKRVFIDINILNRISG